jgi:hypothetical protein
VLWEGAALSYEHIMTICYFLPTSTQNLRNSSSPPVNTWLGCDCDRLVHETVMY